jgi:hypothetical protein
MPIACHTSLRGNISERPEGLARSGVHPSKVGALDRASSDMFEANWS